MTFTHAVTAQGEVTSSGGNWSARVNGSTVYTGNNYVEAINTACNRAGNNATINIRNSGSSGPGIGNIYGARPLAGQTLDFHGTTFNANGDPFIVPVYADRRNGITVRNLRVTGSPRYGIWFRGCSNTTFTNITMDVNSGLGIRVDASTGPASDLTINGDILIEGTSTHAIETYTVGGVDIGDVTCNYTGGCGVLLNDSWDCRVGVVTGNYNNQSGGYATFRVANANENTYCAGVYSRNSGRGFFSVSGSRDCTVEWVDIANTRSHGIFLEDATNTHVLHGRVTNGNPNTQQVRTTNCTINLDGYTGGGGSPGGFSQLRNRGTGLYLDGMGRTTNGEAVGLYGNTSHPNAQWELIDVGNGYSQLRNRGTGLFLDGYGRTENGADVSQYANTTHPNSHWRLQPYTGNYYRLQNRGTGLYLDGMGRTANGENVGQWANTTHPNAQWELVPISANSPARRESERADVVATDGVGFLSVYPNPVSDVLHIRQLEGEDISKLRVYDASGKVVLESKPAATYIDLDVSAWQRGLYIIEAGSASGTRHSRFMRQN